MAEDAKQYALDMHRKWNGKIEVVSRAKIETPEDLAVAYTPGVAQPCLEIQKDLDAATAKADVQIAAKAAESEKSIAEIRDGAAAAVSEVAKDVAAELVAALGVGADAKTVTAAVTARLKG